MNSKELRADIESLYFKSLGFKNSDRIVWLDAVKSILGINLKAVSSDLLNMLVNEFNSNQFYPIENQDYDSMPDAISLYGLEKALLDRDLDSSIKNIYYLSRVSDGIQILEFLLEFSLKYSSKSYRYIWHILRMQKFLNGKYMLESLNKSVLIILSEEYKTMPAKSIKSFLWLDFLSQDFEDIDELLLYYTIYNSELIREKSIKSLLLLRLANIKSSDSNNLNIDGKQLDLDRKWISNYLYEIDGKMLNFNMIVFFNNIRSCLMLSNDELEKQYIWSYLNNRI